MMKRLFALVLALAVVSAPVALEICQVTCESKEMSPSMPHGVEGHAAHHHMPADDAACHEHSGTPQQLSPVNGLCDHGPEATPSLVAGRNSDVAASLLATVPSIGSIGLLPTREDISAPESAWPNRPGKPLAIQLRV